MLGPAGRNSGLLDHGQCSRPGRVLFLRPIDGCPPFEKRREAMCAVVERHSCGVEHGFGTCRVRNRKSFNCASSQYLGMARPSVAHGHRGTCQQTPVGISVGGMSPQTHVEVVDGRTQHPRGTARTYPDLPGPTDPHGNLQRALRVRVGISLSIGGPFRRHSLAGSTRWWWNQLHSPPAPWQAPRYGRRPLQKRGRAEIQVTVAVSDCRRGKCACYLVEVLLSERRRGRDKPSGS